MKAMLLNQFSLSVIYANLILRHMLNRFDQSLLQRSTHCGWAKAIARALDSYGLDSRAIFDHCGVDNRVWTKSDERIDGDTMLTLWQQAVIASEDECFGLRVSQFVLPSNLDALGHGLWASESLEQMFFRLARYRQLVSSYGNDDNSGYEGDEFHIRFGYADEPPESVFDAPFDTFSCFIVRICRQLKGEDFHPLRAEFIRDKPKASDHFSAFFQVPVRYSAPNYLLVFDGAAIREKLLSGNNELAQTFDQMSEHYLSQYEALSLPMQVKEIIKELLPKGDCKQENVAAKLGTSARKLQYELKTLNHSYKSLHEEVRRELALIYLEKQGLSISETCFRLGFKDTSNFTRAFRRWYGQSPTKRLKS